ncbi:CPA1 family monovalent cation:H+ antiporter [Dyadobacter sp. BE34]|uniref:CPA1 family monovalent cation:H+ antiporter n=1 Tax=Dyadobacter fermentans TaxID=94254 RepID=A0ABU1QST9_9BACT|nr:MULTISPECIES: Na+/H+ antiporter [Dyadobacter]MDR6804226.1 CPA1 family monovalent cation:H+ antiporter [Dyadobacter fermentans]MDR7041966.1 CPA1 family monovalent cation:H+ antiporter [Dyadobacter sp. BE242]MDR7196369.1 CPA1 family monovalent cation:H+ antiporter [Dyadobacter sp. BE34]MDR7213086.1 CPA1 family monovalent cation:H+ antiporter [Dyadobacter sp. BE31]MDR7261775.1 CPA1 family monovalent cation:H+ antiporter [Dyadobacter sp. BE32]
MVHQNLLLVLILFFFIALLYLWSERLKVSYPILLVLGGLVISLIPAVPNISLDPDIVFLIFLPPLLFEAAWTTSWKDFWARKESIFSMGFGLVFSTSLIIAYLSVTIIPGFTLALGFLLGGIISPPDAVATSSVLRGLSMPRRGITILEGESLVNDAASLTVFRFATITVLTGHFAPKEAVVDFAVLAFMGMAVGLVIGHLIYLILRYWAKSSRITSPIILIAPYLMYVIAEKFHWSGVLAVVTGGLYLSYHARHFLNYQTRLQNREIWLMLVFLLNAFVFILIGLELPTIVDGLGTYSLREAIGYGLLISATAIIVRIVLVYLATFLPRMLSRNVRNRENSPGWRLTFVMGWAGMRGVVSLAAALTIPLTTQEGSVFPHRNLILFITFIVILVTLVFQGLTLPLVLRLLNVREDEEKLSVQQQIEMIRLHLAQRSAEYMKQHYHSEIWSNGSVKRIVEQLQRTIALADPAQDGGHSARDLKKKIMIELVALQRACLHTLGDENKYDEDVIRDIEQNLDLEESRLKK